MENRSSRRDEQLGYLPATAPVPLSPRVTPNSHPSCSAILQHWLAYATPFSDICKRLTPGQGRVLRAFLIEPSDRVIGA